MYDIIIIGSGITGSIIAHDLSKFQLKVALLEKNNDVAGETTSANSAMIHSGHDPKEGTLKAVMNVRGNAMYPALCEELKVDLQFVGALVVAASEEELPGLEFLYNQAVSRKIPVNYLDHDQALAREPNLTDTVIKAIDLPTTGIVSPFELSIACVEDAMNNGVELFLNNKVIAINQKDYGFEVVTNQTSYQTKVVINAAGLYADEIYNLVSDSKQFKILPRKGEYFVLDKSKNQFVHSVIMPLPSKMGKGVLAVPTVHGNVLIGPNSLDIADKEGIDNTAVALDYIRSEIKRTIKNVPMNTVIHVYSGLRPTSSTGDFIIEEAPDVKNFINVAGIESPGLASAPAISEYVLHTLLKDKFEFKLKEKHVERRPFIVMNHMNAEERAALVNQNPQFAQMICRCEKISEGEIVDFIHRNCGATTVKGLKRRARPGMGRCQGGFCEPKVVDILARELHKTPLEVRMDSEDSVMLISRTKE
jgi:glycerol-3-phosphate dehydrogenase